MHSMEIWSDSDLKICQICLLRKNVSNPTCLNEFHKSFKTASQRWLKWSELYFELLFYILFLLAPMVPCWIFNIHGTFLFYIVYFFFFKWSLHGSFKKVLLWNPCENPCLQMDLWVFVLFLHKFCTLRPLKSCIAHFPKTSWILKEQ